MALCRCRENQNHSNPNGRNIEYIISVEPIGYPNTSSICGRNNCENAGVIWLTKEEYVSYNEGTRVFSFASAVSKVKVQ